MLHCYYLNHTNDKNSKIYAFTLQQHNTNVTLDVACFVKVFQHLVTSQTKQEAEHFHFPNGRRKYVILASSS